MCILVVEDDFLIRTVLVEELEEGGYLVMEAETGDQALALLDAMDPKPYLLVTDIHMPGVTNGLDVAARLRTRLPGLPVIFTTGRPDVIEGTVELGHDQFLIRKPYAPSEVIAHIRRLLPDAARPGSSA